MARAPRKLDQVVDAAIEEFQEGGFTRANMDRIAERAQVSKRTLYNYFPSKEALFLEIIERIGSLFADDGPCDFDPGENVSVQLERLTRRLARPYANADAVRMGRLVIGEWMRNPDLIGGMMAQIEKTSPVDAFFASALEAGAIDREVAETTAADLSAFVKGRCLWPAVLSGREATASDIDRLANSAGELFAAKFKA